MPEDDIQFPQLLPPLGPELLADQALDAVTDQIPDQPDLTANLQVDEPEVYGMTWKWDFGFNLFQTSNGSPASVRDLDNLRIWVEATLNIERGTHPIYDDQVGMEPGSGLVGENVDDPAAQTRYMEAVHDALMVHDRITDVTDFDFYLDANDPDSENEYVDFAIYTDDNDVIPVTLTIPAGA